MSRIGKRPVPVPNGVTVTVNGSAITVKGPKGELSRKLHPDMQVKVENGTVNVGRPSDEQNHRALHGLTRSLIANMVEGVVDGYEKRLEIQGVGYRASLRGTSLELNVGFSHPVVYAAPEGITIETPSQTEIVVRGADKQRVGQVAAEIRAYRSPEPYKGKGVRYSGERIELKETKKK